MPRRIGRKALKLSASMGAWRGAINAAFNEGVLRANGRRVGSRLRRVGSRLPSAGFYAVHAAIALCRSVTLFGFGSNATEGPFHYFSEEPEPRAGKHHHDIALEHAYYRHLVAVARCAREDSKRGSTRRPATPATSGDGSARRVVQCGSVRATLSVEEGPRLVKLQADEEHGPKGGYWAIWDKRRGRSFPSAATVIGDHLLKSTLDSSAPVLLLGLGGAMVPGNLLCGGHRGLVTAVEVCAEVIELCRGRFLPHVFSGACAGQAPLLKIVQADASDVGSFAPRLDAAPHAIVVDFPPAYVRPGSMPAAYWAGLRQLAARCAELVVNTLFRSVDDVALLMAELTAGGWRKVVGPIPVANSCGRNGTRSAGRCNRIVVARGADGCERELKPGTVIHNEWHD